MRLLATPLYKALLHVHTGAQHWSTTSRIEGQKGEGQNVEGAQLEFHLVVDRDGGFLKICTIFLFQGRKYV